MPAAYVFSLGKKDSKDVVNGNLTKCIKNGVYGTIFKTQPTKVWKVPQEGTLADYVSMKEGDYVFFFTERRLYGIGRLKNIEISVDGVKDCKFLNFPDADIPKIFYSDHRKKIGTYTDKKNYLDEINPYQRFICTFEPGAEFYEDGIDMDDALAFKPHCFKMLRAFWKLSFVKLDTEEAQCLFDIVLKYNHGTSTFPTDYIRVHGTLSKKLNNNYLLNSKNIMSYALNSTIIDQLQHEMALEAGVVDQLSRKDSHTISVIGELDYISHQVIASPFKPIDYMDKIDIFGYKYIEDSRAIDKYYILELKKETAVKSDIDQLLKYVDWIKDEYAGQDYSSIKAYLIAYDFEKDISAYVKKHGKRNYTFGRRPMIAKEWDAIILLSYRYDAVDKKLLFTKVII